MVESGERNEAPRGLTTESRRLWADIHAEFQIETATQRLLILNACHTLDRLRSAQKQIKKDGIVIKSRLGAVIPHPAIKIEASARQSLTNMLKAIGFGGEIE